MQDFMVDKIKVSTTVHRKCRGKQHPARPKKAVMALIACTVNTNYSGTPLKQTSLGPRLHACPGYRGTFGRSGNAYLGC